MSRTRDVPLGAAPAWWSQMFRIEIALSVLAVLISPSNGLSQPISFNRDVRPVLARNCFSCHGPDDKKRKAELRLDRRADAVKAGAINPNDFETSELLKRIDSADPDVRMPPPDAGRLSESQRALLRNWVLDGARYEQHWAFIRPTRPKLPVVRDQSWSRNPIDRFVLARLERESLNPSPKADRYALVRRTYLDLIGLPPTPDETDAFVNCEKPQAFERMVDMLLESKHYGERWARPWLDLARYSDTNGYEKDRPRSIWPYRDWVIDALNRDMPFDQFTIEQLAGDMLPNATASQRIATGFHRNTMLNEEGGIDPNEYRFYAMVDRVGTTGTAWMGMTLGCAQCHSHKYDPISHNDYYRVFAMLNNADEPDLAVPDADIAKRRAEVQSQIEREIAGLEKKFPVAKGDSAIEDSRQQRMNRELETWISEVRKNATRWHTLRPHTLTSNLPKLELMPDGSIFSSGDITKRDVYRLTIDLSKQSGLDFGQPITAIRLEAMPDDRLPAGGPGRAFYEGRKGDFFLSEFSLMASKRPASSSPVRFKSGSTSFGKISIGNGSADAKNVFDGEGSTGWSTATREGEAHQLVLNLSEPLLATELTIEMTFERHFAASLGRFRISATSQTGSVNASKLPVDLEAALAKTETNSKTTPTLALKLKREFLVTTPLLKDARKQLVQLKRQMPQYPTSMVLLERQANNPRKTYRHDRGEYLSVREEVRPALPSLFPALEKGLPANRLEFARWLASDRNPLVARVTVNRAWRAFFGTGIVETSGDFGTQSNPPSHPELLDWLAVEFMSNGWSMKQLHRLIVTSTTYRQSSRMTPELLRRDPDNRLLARGSRIRVDAETVRDLMLKSSGLLSAKSGGPSVYPPQPASVTGLAYGNMKWPVSQGEDRYRRSLYTFNKRTAPFAAFTVFDGPTGENCVPRRNRSNTPLQALTLLNDEMFLEMSRAIGAAARDRGSDGKTAEWIFRRLLTRPPTEHELAAILKFRTRQLRRLDAGELDAHKIGGNKSDANQASWTMVARSLMNLDEVITRQ